MVAALARAPAAADPRLAGRNRLDPVGTGHPGARRGPCGSGAGARERARRPRAGRARGPADDRGRSGAARAWLLHACAFGIVIILALTLAPNVSNSPGTAGLAMLSAAGLPLGIGAIGLGAAVLPALPARFRERGSGSWRRSGSPRQGSHGLRGRRPRRGRFEAGDAPRGPVASVDLGCPRTLVL